MAYTASALAFMLRGLRKPVVLTGSQIPLCELRTDARENLLTALMIAAAEEPVSEVSLFFGGRLLRGCRAVKVSATGFDAFDSPNFPPLAHRRDRHHRRPARRRPRRRRRPSRSRCRSGSTRRSARCGCSPACRRS